MYYMANGETWSEIYFGIIHTSTVILRQPEPNWKKNSWREFVILYKYIEINK